VTVVDGVGMDKHEQAVEIAAQGKGTSAPPQIPPAGVVVVVVVVFVEVEVVFVEVEVVFVEVVVVFLEVVVGLPRFVKKCFSFCPRLTLAVGPPPCVAQLVTVLTLCRY
jgi:hypothetical protein